ncbi:hypothetical protein HCN44_010511 [Aphidius gifuensis]|uniref:Nudix hydrolase domain-containing protein n=1 Tax=Aphidius gifuensis TaxID=684658 RepID=A0A834XQR2_APHGI|nr:hypothetical protein HCN44_010511 [Aphidius gifuensis]
MLKMKPWREAASIILCARSGKKINKKLSSTIYDYKLLSLKRHKNSSFMPEHYVFPGGVIEQSDADLKWSSLYSKFGFDSNSFTSLLPKTNTRPYIFNKSRSNELPREISLRITAIRETFEECGILICKKLIKNNNTHLSLWAEHENFDCQSDVMINWQKKVHEDSNEFYRMCDKFQCYPDIWALHEWSNWLTPTIFRNKRFDTAFFMTFMEAQPVAHFDPAEMEDLRWDYPQDLLSQTNGLQIPPPQYYEIARIGKFESLDNLFDHAVERSHLGCHLNMAVKVNLSDGSVYLLPGDSLYPDEVSLTDKMEIDKSNMTISEYRYLAHVKNRMEFYEFQVQRIVSDNFQSNDGHLSPMSGESINIKINKNKL